MIFLNIVFISVILILSYTMVCLSKYTFMLEERIKEYEDKQRYIESICEQCVDISQKTEKKLEDHIKSSRTKTQRAYLKGVSDGKKIGRSKRNGKICR